VRRLGVDHVGQEDPIGLQLHELLDVPVGHDDGMAGLGDVCSRPLAAIWRLVGSLRTTSTPSSSSQVHQKAKAVEVVHGAGTPTLISAPAERRCSKTRPGARA